MRFMMLMIPKGYEKAEPGKMPDAKDIARMMKYNEQLQKAGVLLELNGLHPPASAARVTFSRRRADRHRRAVQRVQRGCGRVLDDPGEIARGSH